MYLNTYTTFTSPRVYTIYLC